MGAQGKDATEPEPESLTIGQKVKANLVAGKDAAAKGFGAAAASVGSAANSCYDKASTLPGAVKPTAQAAWGWTKQGAADSFDATRIFLSEFTTAEMAVCEAKFRAARRRQEADKKDFGERILESLAAECGDALTSAKGAKVVGCLREGSESLQLYMESQAKFKEHEEAMAAARKEYEEVRCAAARPARERERERERASDRSPKAPPPCPFPVPTTHHPSRLPFTPLSNGVPAQVEGQGHLEGRRGVREDRRGVRLGQQAVGLGDRVSAVDVEPQERGRRGCHP